jgi:hypothetical protein
MEDRADDLKLASPRVFAESALHAGRIAKQNVYAARREARPSSLKRDNLIGQTEFFV